jgi:hypothetical protein
VVPEELEGDDPADQGLSIRPPPDGSDITKVAEADVPHVAKALARVFLPAYLEASSPRNRALSGATASRWSRR